MKVDQARILKHLEEVLGEGVINSEEVDVTARKIYSQLIEPLLDYNKHLMEGLRSFNQKEKDVH